MILADTSVIVGVLRVRGTENVERLFALIGGEDIVFTRFTELEVLMGARDKRDWDWTATIFDRRLLIDPTPDTWRRAARLYFDLRRNGRTVRNVVDCCIAQIAIEKDLELVHNDRDFEVIADVTPLKQTRLKLRRS